MRTAIQSANAGNSSQPLINIVDILSSSNEFKPMVIAGNLVEWSEVAGQHLEDGQFQYCYSADHFDEVIVNPDFDAKKLKAFLDNQNLEKKQKNYYSRIAPRFWGNILYGAPLPVGERIYHGNPHYSSKQLNRPSFPPLNRLRGLSLVRQFRRMFQLRFLIHYGFTEAAMTKNLMTQIESNFKKIFFPVIEGDDDASEDFEDRYDEICSYNLTDNGEFSFDNYMSRFQTPPLYEKKENILKVTPWNYVELMEALQPFETMVRELFGFKFNETSGRYVARNDYHEPTWGVGYLVRGVPAAAAAPSAADDDDVDEDDDAGAAHWEESSPGQNVTLVKTEVLRELRSIVRGESIASKDKDYCLHSYTNLHLYIRYLLSKNKKVRKTNIDANHKKMIRLLICGSGAGGKVFKPPKPKMMRKRMKFIISTFLPGNAELLNQVTELTDDDSMDQREDIVDAIHSALLN